MKTELKTIEDFAGKKLVKTSNGKYYNYGYTASVCLHPSTRDADHALPFPTVYFQDDDAE